MGLLSGKTQGWPAALSFDCRIFKNHRHWLCYFIGKIYDAKVNFSGKFNNYCEAFQHCINSDKQCLLSEDHPVLTSAPKATFASPIQFRKTHRFSLI